jgi:hypothetical protein
MSRIPQLLQLRADFFPRPGIASAAPLSAFLRVPLSWYHSQTFPFFPDETGATIRRLYSHPSEQYVQRRFCGFCGTPLSVWSEQPRSEAEYIQLTLGSLLTEDLHGLEEWGILPGDSGDEDDVDKMDVVPTATPDRGTGSQLIGRDFNSVPWFEGLLSGSRLGNVHTTKGAQQSQDGTVRVEWEISEWTDAGHDRDGDEDDASASESSAKGKRKRVDTDEGKEGGRA